MLHGVASGVAGNSFRTVEAAALPRYFGTDNLGEIRGIVVAVAASAVGPLMLAVGREWVESYRPPHCGWPSFLALLAVAARCCSEPRSCRSS